jgi:hypothetical protein
MVHRLTFIQVSSEKVFRHQNVLKHVGTACRSRMIRHTDHDVAGFMPCATSFPVAICLQRCFDILRRWPTSPACADHSCSNYGLGKMDTEDAGSTVERPGGTPCIVCTARANGTLGVRHVVPVAFHFPRCDVIPQNQRSQLKAGQTQPSIHYLWHGRQLRSKRTGSTTTATGRLRPGHYCLKVRTGDAQSRQEMPSASARTEGIADVGKRN